jgi:HNH endonuclease
MMSAKEAELSLGFLKSVLSYEPETGLFRWATSEGGVTIGAIAGNVNTNGYLVVGLRGTKYRQHRLAWFYHYGVWPTGTVDHRDCNRANNSIGNLRDVPQAVNMQNQRKATRVSTSGVLGVYWSERRQGFMASISINQKQKRRGPYKTIERATSAHLDLKRTYHEGCTL